MTLDFRQIAFVAIAVLSASAYALYTYQPDVLKPDAQVNAGKNSKGLMSPIPTISRKQAGSISDLIGPLKRRLKQQPDDVSSWILLGKSYDYLNQTSKAREAYQKAKELGSIDPAIAAALAPKTSRSDAQPLDAKLMMKVGRQLDRMPDVTSAVQSSSNQDITIAGRITVADELRDRIAPGHKLFIFAKAPNGQGMPLVVFQTSANQFPFDYELDNSMVMVAGQSLVTKKNIQVVARISATGDATRHAGDLMATSTTIALLQNNTVNLEINQIIP